MKNFIDIACKINKNVAYIILQELERNGELTIDEVAKLLPKKYKDHRDFYIFASLIAEGLIDDPFLVESDSLDSNKNKTQLLARKYFAMSNADKSVTYEGHTWSIHGGKETLRGQKVALSGKGSLYLMESRSKRCDRIFSLASGIIVGIVVAIVSAQIRRTVGS